MSLRCNGCWSGLEAKSQCVATACGHLYCLKCAQSIVESESTCPICEQMMTKSNIKLVNVLQAAGGSKLTLCGQTPEMVLQTALSAINFYMQQQALQNDYKEAQLNKKIGKVQEACRKKLEEVHNGYQAAKRKYQEVVQQKTALEQDNQELQQKYSQKAMQARKLQEMFKRLQQENESLRHGAGRSQGSNRSISPVNPGQMITTVHRSQQVFSTLPDGSPTNPNVFGGGNQLLPSSQQAVRPSTAAANGRRPGILDGIGSSGAGAFIGGAQLRNSEPDMRRGSNIFGNTGVLGSQQPSNNLRKLLGPHTGGNGGQPFFIGSPSGMVSM